jgi:hypothetical protein
VSASIALEPVAAVAAAVSAIPSVSAIAAGGAASLTLGGAVVRAALVHHAGSGIATVGVIAVAAAFTFSGLTAATVATTAATGTAPGLRLASTGGAGVGAMGRSVGV